MRNKEQEFVWQKVIEACMENVKHHFDDIQQAIEFVAKFFSKGKIVFRIWTNIIRLFLIHGMEQVKV